MAKMRMIEVAEQLLKRAKAGTVGWKKDFGDQRYLLVFPDMAFAISRLSWLPRPPLPPPGFPTPPVLRGLGTYGYKLELLDQNGGLIESLAATVGDPEHRMLKDIYEVAEIGEQNIDASIDKALEYLKNS